MSIFVSEKEAQTLIFPVSLGKVRVLYLSDFLLKLEFKTSFSRRRSFSEVALPTWLSDLKESLEAYFTGSRVVFNPPLYLKPWPPFYQKVFRTAQKIPYGETRSYQWLAEEVGNPRAQRAVGQALKHNPFLILVPCHRVIRGDGSLGGWSGEGGLKEKLLQLEKIGMK